MGLAMVCKKLAVLCSATTEPFLSLSVSLMFYGLPEDRQTTFLQLFREDNFQSVAHWDKPHGVVHHSRGMLLANSCKYELQSLSMQNMA